MEARDYGTTGVQRTLYAAPRGWNTVSDVVTPRPSAVLTSFCLYRLIVMAVTFSEGPKSGDIRESVSEWPDSALRPSSLPSRFMALRDTARQSV